MTQIDRIYQEYFTDVYKYLLVITKNEALAEELTQETFFKAMKNLKKFKGECSIYSWLCTIAKNTYLNFIKKQKNFSSLSESENNIFDESSLIEKIEENETSFEIHQALHSLDEPYKEVFQLKIFGELSYTQIAKLFNKTESWARVTYHRAKLKIREKIK